VPRLFIDRFVVDSWILTPLQWCTHTFACMFHVSLNAPHSLKWDYNSLPSPSYEKAN
jgi:hypothetical protein